MNDQAIENLSPDNALIIRDVFHSLILAQHGATRALIQSIRADQLEFPLPGGKTMRDFVWEILAVEHLQLATICDAQVPTLCGKPEGKEVNLILAWYDEHLHRDYERLAQMSGEDLLRRLEFPGQSKPTIAFLPGYLSVILQNRGLLVGYLAARHAQPRSLDSLQMRCQPAPAPVNDSDKQHAGAC